MTRGRKNPLHKGLPLRLRTAREATGLTLRDMASMAELSGSIVHYTENGRIPRLDTIERLAVVLGVSPCWLSFGEDGSDPFRQKIPRSAVPPRYVILRAMDAKEATPHYGGVGQRLRDAREEQGLSRRELGRSADSSGTTVLNIEDNRTIPRIDMVERLAVALGVAPCWLAFGAGSPDGSGG